MRKLLLTIAGLAVLCSTLLAQQTQVASDTLQKGAPRASFRVRCSSAARTIARAS